MYQSTKSLFPLSSFCKLQFGWDQWWVLVVWKTKGQIRPSSKMNVSGFATNLVRVKLGQVLKWMGQSCSIPFLSYDMKSDEGSNWVRQGDESESAKIGLKQVKWTFIYAYLWQTMWNHAKKSMEGSKRSDSVFLQWDARSSVLKTPKKHEKKRN